MRCMKQCKTEQTEEKMKLYNTMSKTKEVPLEEGKDVCLRTCLQLHPYRKCKTDDRKLRSEDILNIKDTM